MQGFIAKNYTCQKPGPGGLKRPLGGWRCKTHGRM